MLRSLLALWLLSFSIPVQAQEVVGEETSEDDSDTDDPDAASTEPEPDFVDPEDDWDVAEEDDMRLSDLTVEGVADQMLHTGGSVHVLGEEYLDEMNYDDVMSVLPSVPGVYVRQEDGYGLRPNIGIRGANAERSRRITLMEDGVLLGPAPYSAPAAYYFPLTTRMTSIEVYMGSAAIPYGPHTVGGAVDLHGRSIPLHSEGGVDLALGTTWLGRFHGHYGTSNEWGGFVVELVHLRTDGFRNLDPTASTGAPESNTGFDRTDLQVRGELHGDFSPEVYHRLEATFGLGLESSNESYLGLALQDFSADPLRRYGISAGDHMSWWRTRAQLRYELLADDVDFVVTAYRHDFERSWRRLDRFRDGTALTTVLASPDDPRYGVYYDVLTGAETPPTLSLGIVRATNARRFVSQGVQARGRFRFTAGVLRSELEVGARFHFDSISRVHTGDGVYLERGAIVSDGLETQILTDNYAQSFALSGYVAWQFRFFGLTVTPGLRIETIWSEYTERVAELPPTSPQQILTTQFQPLPGLGLTYELLDPVTLFAGVHQGYSPVAPGQPEGVRPELAWNYEVGARYGRADESTNGQLSFFLSDYQNLTGECSGAGGCPIELIDRQFNGDQATILGVELVLAHEFVVDELHVPLRANYTYTFSRFRTAFVSENPQFGAVEVGDRLPYIPEHQGSFRAGLSWRFISFTLNGLVVGAMRDAASRGNEGLFTEEQFYLDAVAHVEVYDGVRLYVRAENILDVRPIVSYRPFGARTGRPFLFQGGLEADF
jgi:Fe(3+) dicitrate transport protein